MQQLPLELAVRAPASLSNFVAGPNAEALGLMQALAAGERPASPILLWGPAGSGKSHLIDALPGARVLRPDDLPDDATLSDHELLTLDDIENWNDAALDDLFLLLNRLRVLPRHVIVIGACQPPAGLALRDDLRSRLAAGLVIALRTPSDGDREQALRRMLAERGLADHDAVVHRLMTRHTRDIRYLAALVAALDSFALARARPLTGPLLREFEQSGDLARPD
ncbi:MAG: DnaA/Hda family protein [Burkholderiaceae bacterium]